MVFFSRRFSCGCVERWPRQLTRSHLTLSCQPDFAAFPPAPTAISQWCSQSNGRRPAPGGDWCVARSSLRRLPGGGDRPYRWCGYGAAVSISSSIRQGTVAVFKDLEHGGRVVRSSPQRGGTPKPRVRTPRRKAWAEPWGCEWRRECTLKGCDKTDVAPSVTGHIAHPRQSAFGIAAALLETRVTRGGCYAFHAARCTGTVAMRAEAARCDSD